METVRGFIFLGSKIIADGDCSHDQHRQHIKKQRHYFADKGPSSQSYGFSNSHVWMWELDYKEGSVPKNWCFQIMVLKKTLESPLDSKESNQSILKKSTLNIHWKDWNWSWILWPPDVKSQLIEKDLDSGKNWRQEEKGTTEDEMGGWHHWLDEREFEWTAGVGDGQGGLVCCNSWGRKELERLNWTDGPKLLVKPRPIL